MRKLIDANVILRYLLADHPQMAEEAKQVIEIEADKEALCIGRYRVLFYDIGNSSGIPYIIKTLRGMRTAA